MDLVDIIRHRIDALPDGAHSVGLRSVLRHVETAYRHLARGQKEPDESAFTDAIYRANQAFEGSIKEAFRVLAGKDPQKAKPYQIELYLEENKIFRNRVLAQFTNYRTEWRNPSTHDYNLDFDEDEPFLAIVSVSAFTKLLIDQVAERLSFVAVRDDAKSLTPPPELKSTNTEKLTDRAIAILREFVRHYASNRSNVPLETEAQLIGALAGFFSTVAPDIFLETERPIGAKLSHYIDLVLSRQDEQVIVEIKRAKNTYNIGDAIIQLANYLSKLEKADGILFLYSPDITDYSLQIIPIVDASSNLRRSISVLRHDGIGKKEPSKVRSKK